MPSALNVLTFFLASDTHLGHDVCNVTCVTSLELNKAAVQEINVLAGNGTWPADMGGSVIQEPVALVITGDLVDNGVRTHPRSTAQRPSRTLRF